MDRKNKGKILYTLQMISILPLLFLGIVILMMGFHFFTRAMYDEVETELQCVASSANTLLDTAYPGDYTLVGDTAYRLLKGDQDITTDYSLIDRIKEDTGLEITLFYQDTRILTTIRNSSGERVIGTGASDIVISDVLSSGESHFYNNAVIYGSFYFSYYTPLRNADGTIVGMLFVGKPRSQVDAAIQHCLYPLFFAVLVTIIVMALCIFHYTKGIVSVLLKIRNFLSEVSGGNLDTDLAPDVLKRNDELGEIGQSVLNTQRSLRNMVEQDALTELYNRRFADRKLRQIMAKSVEQQTPFCLSIGDIDYFKKINDTYGHDCGDLVLKKIADTLRDHMRSQGFVARWGGEEFLLVFDRMTMEEAVQSIQKLQDTIHNLKIPYEESTISLTMTFGLADGDSTNLNELLRRADDKLYAGKSAGRDCLMF